ncbi:hypothetical protein PUN28_017242 [Cardiocondyla obscurior]|uniref:Uncharacterized protein n=1 Tax=Cardiocondyla obscurior TaxID=286306 RepID=A0AAW2EKZ6_9HYME
MGSRFILYRFLKRYRLFLQLVKANSAKAEGNRNRNASVLKADSWLRPNNFHGGSVQHSRDFILRSLLRNSDISARPNNDANIPVQNRSVICRSDRLHYASAASLMQQQIISAIYFYQSIYYIDISILTILKRKRR